MQKTQRACSLAHHNIGTGRCNRSIPQLCFQGLSSVFPPLKLGKRPNLGLSGDIKSPTVCISQGNTPYTGLYGEAPPKRGTFLRFRYLKG